MKKLMIGAGIVCLMANMAMATGFDFGLIDPIEVPVGGSVDVILLSNAGTTGGMSLYLEALGGFEITGMAGRNIGGFWTMVNTTYQQVEIYDAGFNLAAAGPYGILGVGSAGNLALPEDVVLAKITISAGSLPLGAAGLLTTNGAILGPSTLSDPAGTGQDEVGLRVTPEPATALLLLGALPMLRRRRA